MGVWCPCPPVRNDIVTPRHLLSGLTICCQKLSQTNLQNSLCKIELKTLNFSLFSKRFWLENIKYKQGRIHSKTVADGWAGAVIQKSLEIQKYLGQTYRPTDLRTDTARCRVACPQLKTRWGIGHLKKSCSIQSKIKHEKNIQTLKMTIVDLLRAPKFKPWRYFICFM